MGQIFDSTMRFRVKAEEEIQSARDILYCRFIRR